MVIVGDGRGGHLDSLAVEIMQHAFIVLRKSRRGEDKRKRVEPYSPANGVAIVRISKVSHTLFTKTTHKIETTEIVPEIQQMRARVKNAITKGCQDS